MDVNNNNNKRLNDHLLNYVLPWPVQAIYLQHMLCGNIFQLMIYF